MIKILINTLLIVSSMVLFDFDSNSDLSNWVIVDDVVMGGRSNGQFEINEDGNGVFSGKVSLENNGGFSSVRYNRVPLKIEKFTTVEIRLKGDSKSYQFRTKSDKDDRHSYIHDFETTGDWQIIKIPMSDMEPRFRGRKLDMPNYPSQVLEEIAFLIGNKKNESFRIEIDYIALK